MKRIKLLLPVIMILLVSSCAGIKFNQASQDQTLQLKNLTERTIDLSVGEYAENEATLQLLSDAYKSVIASEEKRGKTNYPTISMWKQLDVWVNTDFATTWKQQGKITPDGAKEIKRRVNVLFDHIISLEQNKIK